MTKRWNFTYFIIILFSSLPLAVYSQAPFSRGVNLTGWFQVDSPQQIQFTKFTKQDIINIKSLGCNVIRLPVNLHSMTSGSPAYTLDPLYLSFQDSVVSWCEQLHIYLMIDNHSFDPNLDTSPGIGNILTKVWTQMAGDHPWRLTFTIDENIVAWDRKWHHLHIPLSSFRESGSWDNNTWYNPSGKFDWTAIDRFEISTEYPVSAGNKLWFDNIIVTNKDTATVRESGILGIEQTKYQSDLKLKVTPNPMSYTTTISYTLSGGSLVSVSIFSITGQKICTLLNETQAPGPQTLIWHGSSENGAPVQSGLYICVLKTKEYSVSEKILKY